MRVMIGKELSDKLNPFWITGVRDPVDRYLSEWRHVSRGATWNSTKLTCRNQTGVFDFGENIVGKCHPGHTE